MVLRYFEKIVIAIVNFKTSGVAHITHGASQRVTAEKVGKLVLAQQLCL